MNSTRRKLYSYLGVVAVYVLVFSWWMVYFSRQDDILLRRIERAGVALDPAEVQALRRAAEGSMRMFVYEGAFLGLLLFASVGLVLRSLHRELAVQRAQRNFLSAVTHELKSPIASVKLYVDSLLLGRAEGEKRERYLQHAREDLERLHGLVDELLESARVASAGPRLGLERLDLSAFAASALERLRREQPFAALDVRLQAPAPVAVQADAAALEKVLRNLLSNAAKYGAAKPGGESPRVEVIVERAGGRAVLRVRDFGPGLRGVDAERIFDPFVRGGEELTRARPGVGLGLYLVAELVRAHRGTVEAFSPPQGGGLAVEVRLPAAGEPA